MADSERARAQPQENDETRSYEDDDEMADTTTDVEQPPQNTDNEERLIAFCNEDNYDYTRTEGGRLVAQCTNSGGRHYPIVNMKNM